MTTETGQFTRFVTRGAPPTGTCLVLIRHGDAKCAAEGVVGGPFGCSGLTDTGVAQASALRDRLISTGELGDVVALYTSVLPRAIETAQIIRAGLARGLPLVQDCDLCELHPGAADALRWEEVASRYGFPDWDQRPEVPFAPDAESWLDFYERCVRVFDRIIARHPGGRVVLVVHGGVIEQAMKILAGDPPARRLGLRTENCSMTEIEFDGDRRRLLRYNDLAPLAAE